MPRRNLTLIILVAVVSLACYHRAARNRYASLFADAVNVINANYVERVEPRALFDAAMKGMTGELDPYSSYLTAEDYRQFHIGIDQNLEGIGIEVTLDPKTRRLTIITPLVGTPAYEAGVRAGDIIASVNGEDTTGWKLQDAVGVLRGKPGSTVTLGVLHKGDDKPVDLVIERAKFQIESVLGDTRNQDGSWNFYLEEYPHIGYVRLTTFGEHTVAELKEVLKFKDHPVDGLILDLRNNPGGLLNAAVDVCDMFLDDGVIVSTRGRDKKEIETHYAVARKTIVPRDMPLAVLVDNGSASASEIVAACLQDHKRGEIIGERSWGKGTVQNLVEMEGGKTALKLTVATYWRPSGKNIHRLKSPEEDPNGEWGVSPEPEYVVKLTDEQLERLARWRRDRDIVLNGAPPKEADGGATEESPVYPQGEIADPEVDPQLRKAVEYIESQLVREKSTRGEVGT